MFFYKSCAFSTGFFLDLWKRNKSYIISRCLVKFVVAKSIRK